MYVYTDINTQIIVCIQISYHSCKSYIITHISVRINKNKYPYSCLYICYLYLYE